MTKIVYVKGNLFDAPYDQLLVHACNCQGVWGSGVAAEFKRQYPTEYALYKMWCENRPKKHLIGTTLLVNQVGCLFTSVDYGVNVDSVTRIVENTKYALNDLQRFTTMDIAMPKINSGLFKVPWELTEKVILEANLKQTVYVYELE